MASEPLRGLFLPFYSFLDLPSCHFLLFLLQTHWHFFSMVKSVSFQHRPSCILFSQSGMLLHHSFISFSLSLLIYQLKCHFFKDLFLTSPLSWLGSFCRSLFIFFGLPVQFDLYIQCLFPSLDCRVYESRNHVYFKNHHCLAQ